MIISVPVVCRQHLYALCNFPVSPCKDIYTHTERERSPAMFVERLPTGLHGCVRGQSASLRFCAPVHDSICLHPGLIEPKRRRVGLYTTRGFARLRPGGSPQHMKAQRSRRSTATKTVKVVCQGTRACWKESNAPDGRASAARDYKGATIRSYGPSRACATRRNRSASAIGTDRFTDPCNSLPCVFSEEPRVTLHTLVAPHLLLNRRHAAGS